MVNNTLKCSCEERGKESLALSRGDSGLAALQPEQLQPCLRGAEQDTGAHWHQALPETSIV